jgi:branched-chain amino acid transport system ATP-binding protein
MKANGALLGLDRVTAGYGPVVGIADADLEVWAGEVVCVLGVNGAGKTTLLRSVAGMVRPTSGRILLDGDDLTGRRPEEMVRRGVAMVPEGRQLFGTLSVRDNLLLGAYRFRSDRGAVREALDEVFDLFPAFRGFADRPASSLSGGEQQMVAIARALMTKPRLLMLDEPSLGLAPLMVKSVMELVARLAGEDRGVLLVEQLARVALQIANRGYLLEGGRVVLEGTSADLQADDRVREIYMGIKR